MKTTTEPERKDAKGQDRQSATEGSQPSDDSFDPDFPIEVEGGPSDGGGGSIVSPPKRGE